MASVLDSILSAVTTTVQGLNFSGAVATSNIKRRMLPKVSETLDSLPCILVAPGPGGEQVEDFSFEDGVAKHVVYQVEVVVVAASNHDYATNEATYEDWRQTVRRAFQSHSLAGVPTVFQISLRPSPPFDRRLLNEQYAYSGLVLLVHAAESRS